MRISAEASFSSVASRGGDPGELTIGPKLPELPCGVEMSALENGSTGVASHAAQVAAILLGCEFGPPLRPEISEHLAREILRIGLDNKLLKPILKQFARLGVEVPQDLQSEVATYLRKAMKNNAAAIATVREASQQLSEAGVPHAAFKGPVRQIALGEDAFERPVADVDLLVGSANFVRATEALNRLGYWVPPICDSPWWRHYLGEHAMFPGKPGRLQLDLHHRVQQPSCPRPRFEGALIQDLRAVDVGGREIQTLGPTSTFLHTVISIVKGLVNREPAGAHVLDLARQLHRAADAQLRAFDEAARGQGLAKSSAIARRSVIVLTGVEASPAPPWIVPDDELLARLLTPRSFKMQTRMRRRLLWHLVDDPTPWARAINFTREIAWSAAAELSRRTHDVSQFAPRAEPATGGGHMK